MPLLGAGSAVRIRYGVTPSAASKTTPTSLKNAMANTNFPNVRKKRRCNNDLLVFIWLLLLLWLLLFLLLVLLLVLSLLLPLLLREHINLGIHTLAPHLAAISAYAYASAS